MKKLNKLIITEILLDEVLCTVCAVFRDQKVVELRLEPSGKKNTLNNIYVGQVENIAANIQAAFVRLSDSVNGYLPLNQCTNAIYADGRKSDQPLRPGDQLLVQINREIGFSNKLSKEESSLLNKWLEEERNLPDRPYGLIARTNAAEATKEEFLHELNLLKKQYEKTALHGRNRTCYSLLYESESFYLAAVRDIYTRDLDEIVTDIPAIYEKISEYLSEFQPDKLQILNLYQDKLLPLYKLYSLESAIDEVRHEKIWLKSGGFLVIQQTEAFVSIDVNSGKYTAKKKAEETYRKINLEAATEIARQIRLRNLSGIILVDFINMQNLDHQDELFHVLQKQLRKDPVKCKAIDITPLHILEMTRQKVRRPLIEDLRDLHQQQQ